MTKASFIMGCYQKQSYVSEAIRSIVNQSEKDIELIIVDDASTDHSKEVLEYYKSVDPRVKVFYNKENLGISKTYNIATSHINSDVIIVAAADDVYAPDRAKWTLEYFKENPDIDVVYFPFMKVDWELQPYFRVGGSSVRTADKFDGDFLRKPEGQFIPHGFSSYRKRVADRVKYREDLRHGCDHPFFIDVYDAGFKFGNIEDNKKLAGSYRFTDDMVSVKYRKDIVEQDIKIAKEEVKK